MHVLSRPEFVRAASDPKTRFALLRLLSVEGQCEAVLTPVQAIMSLDTGKIEAIGTRPSEVHPSGRVRYLRLIDPSELFLVPVDPAETERVYQANRGIRCGCDKKEPCWFCSRGVLVWWDRQETKGGGLQVRS